MLSTITIAFHAPNIGTLMIFSLLLLAGVAIHATLATYSPTNKYFKFKGTEYFLIFLTSLVALAGVITHATLASSYTESKIHNLFTQPNTPVPAKPGKPTVLPPNLVFLGNNDGVYNYERTINGVSQSLLQTSTDYAFTWHSDWIATDIVRTYFPYLPYPFLIPFILHLLSLSIIRIPLHFIRRGSGKLIIHRPFATHTLIASLYAYAIMVLFQSARMFWASDGWNTLVYLNTPAYGNILLYTLLGFAIALYIYSIIGTANLRVVRRENGRFNRCLNCKYELANLTDPCPECGSDPNEPARSKLRIRPSVFAGAAALTFFSPFILANIFDLFV